MKPETLLRRARKMSREEFRAHFRALTEAQRQELELIAKILKAATS